MDWNVLLYILYGLILGLGEILPVSPSAHGVLITFMTTWDNQQPLMLLMCHFASLVALVICLRHRIAHIRAELRIASTPPRRRKRQPDLIAVLDGRVITAICVPMAICLLLSRSAYSTFDSLPMLTLMLVISGILVYIPQFLRGANRDARHMSRKDSLILGLCAGLSAIPGISRMGALLSAGLMRGCEKHYILDVALLASIPALVVLILVDAVALITAGLAGITAMAVLYCALAAAAAFGGTWLAILVMRFLSVNAGYSVFAYYSWGLGLFSFILYLMV